MAKAAKRATVKRAVAKKPTTVRRRRNNPGVREIPTISASTLRSSISSTPSAPADALISKIGNGAPLADQMLPQSEVRFVVINEDVEEVLNGFAFRTLSEALREAKSEGEERVEERDGDYTYDVYQLVARVHCEKPDGIKATVSMVGSSPA